MVLRLMDHQVVVNFLCIVKCTTLDVSNYFEEMPMRSIYKSVNAVRMRKQYRGL